MFYDFQTTTHAKWILAGEHAVVRGNGALVFPLPLKTFELSFNEGPDSLTLKCSGNNEHDMQRLFLDVIEKGMGALNRSMSDITGQFTIKTDIPIGAGLGASAALSAAITKWFIYKKLLSEDNLFSFAKQIEDLFHGKSSGLDIIGSTTDKGVYFQGGNFYPIAQTWSPIWCLSFCSQIGITSDCIQKVHQIWLQDETYAKKIDNQMQESVNDALRALTAPTNGNNINNLYLLARAINKANECFAAWGLINENLNDHINNLRTKGAIAAKPTGSGHGGYVISLWDCPPPLKLQENLIIL